MTTENKAPEFEVKILREPDRSPTIVACKMPTPCRTDKIQGIKVDLVIKEVDGEVTVSGEVKETME